MGVKKLTDAQIQRASNWKKRVDKAHERDCPPLCFNQKFFLVKIGINFVICYKLQKFNAIRGSEAAILAGTVKYSVLFCLVTQPEGRFFESLPPDE